MAKKKKRPAASTFPQLPETGMQRSLAESLYQDLLNAQINWANNEWSDPAAGVEPEEIQLFDEWGDIPRGIGAAGGAFAGHQLIPALQAVAASRKSSYGPAGPVQGPQMPPTVPGRASLEGMPQGIPQGPMEAPPPPRPDVYANYGADQGLPPAAPGAPPGVAGPPGLVQPPPAPGAAAVQWPPPGVAQSLTAPLGGELPQPDMNQIAQMLATGTPANAPGQTAGVVGQPPPAAAQAGMPAADVAAGLGPPTADEIEPGLAPPLGAMQDPGTPWGAQEHFGNERISSLVDLMGAPPNYPQMSPAQLSPIQAVLSGLADVLYTKGRGTHDPVSMRYMDRAQRRATDERDKQYQAQRDEYGQKYTAGLRQAQAQLGLERDELRDARSQRGEERQRAREDEQGVLEQQRALDRIKATGEQRRETLGARPQRLDTNISKLINSRPKGFDEGRHGERYNELIDAQDYAGLADFAGTISTEHSLSQMPFGQAQDIRQGLRDVNNKIDLMSAEELAQMADDFGGVEPIIRRLLIKSTAGGVEDAIFDQQVDQITRRVNRELGRE